ncbi:MAG: hypothetical protein K6E78_00210, partial [Treponema sp.]|nr:hypothetical protein [Treponema sp.]
MYNNEEFVPESFGYIYQYECTETIARISDPGVNYYSVEMVQKEAERNLNWVRKMLPSFEFKEEKDNYEFFYTCALLFFTYRAIAFKKDVKKELCELKNYIQDAIKRCRAFPAFATRVGYTEKKEDGESSCGGTSRGEKISGENSSGERRNLNENACGKKTVDRDFDDLEDGYWDYDDWG